MDDRKRQVQQMVVREARKQRAMRLARARRDQWRFRLARLRRALFAVAGIIVATLGAGAVFGGIPDNMLVLVLLLTVVTFVLLSIYPATPKPRADTLGAAELPELAASAELWLESRRRALPAAAIDAVDMIGVRLEQLSPQLAMLDPGTPAAYEVRKLLSEHLPALVDSYTRIPPSVRGTHHAGSTPGDQLVDGLNVIAGEIESMSLALSRNDLDALAVRGRYLETKYVTASKDPA